MVYTRRRSRNLSVVCGRIEVYNVESILEEADTWDKRFALNAVEVQFVWVPVRGSD
jgi:hypothetical protein